MKTKALFGLVAGILLWLRILEFSEDGKRISVRTFSPFFARSSSTCHLAWRTEPYNKYVFEIGE